MDLNRKVIVVHEIGCLKFKKKYNCISQWILAFKIKNRHSNWFSNK